MDKIFIEQEFQYALSKQICKCLKFRAFIITLHFTTNTIIKMTKAVKKIKCMLGQKY
jgi:hypothetical protein